MRRSLATFFAVTALSFVVLAPPASAVSWYSSSSPLVAYEDGTAQAKAYGNFYNSQNSYAKSMSYQRDPRPGGDAVFVDIDYLFDHYDGNTTVFQFFGNDQTTRTDNNSWIQYYETFPLRDESTKARGRIKTCEDQSFSFDPCSATTLPTFSY